MLDYGLNFLNTPIYCDNESAIALSKDTCNHSKAKHIFIRFHFIRDCVEKKLVNLVKIHTDDQRADLFTKAFDRPRFEFLLKVNGMKEKQD